MRPQLTEEEKAAVDRQTLAIIAGLATEAVVKGRGDEMIGLPLASIPRIPGEIRRGMNREVSAVNILFYVMDRYVVNP